MIRTQREQKLSLGFVILDFVRYFEHIDIIMELCKKLKLIRKRLDFTQDQIAEKLGLTSEARRGRISEWESGKNEPKRKILLKYSELANIDVKKLIDDRETLNI